MLRRRRWKWRKWRSRKLRLRKLRLSSMRMIWLLFCLMLLWVWILLSFLYNSWSVWFDLIIWYNLLMHVSFRWFRYYSRLVCRNWLNDLDLALVLVICFNWFDNKACRCFWYDVCMISWIFEIAGCVVGFVVSVSDRFEIDLIISKICSCCEDIDVELRICNVDEHSCIRNGRK